MWVSNFTTFHTGPSVTSATITLANTGTAGTVFGDELSVVPNPLPDGQTLTPGRYVTSACLESKKGNPPYGYYECRMKPSDTNSFSAFWFWYAANGTNAGEELDVAEEVGNPTQDQTDRNGHPYADDMTVTSHYFPDKYTNIFNTDPHYVSTPVADGFHVYGVDWEPNVIKYYFDGNYMGEFTQVQPPAVPTAGQTQVLHLNWLELDTEVQPGYGVLNGSAEFQVDYVRAWTK